MPWSSVGTAQNDGQSALATVTHNLSIQSGDLIVITLNVNGPRTITPIQGTGAAWSTARNSDLGIDESAQEAMFYKTANGAEPADLECTLGASDFWNMTVQVFRSTTTFSFISIANAYNAADQSTLNCDATDTVVVADDSVGVVCGGMDNRSGAPAIYDTATQSFTGVVGNQHNQVHASAHRIFATGTTIVGGVGITGPANVSDPTYSMFGVWTEDAALPAITSVGGDDVLVVGETGALIIGTSFGT